MSAALEFRFFLVQKRLIAGPEILGIEAGEAFLFLGIAQRLRIGQPVQKLPVPAVNQGRAVGDEEGDIELLRELGGLGNLSRSDPGRRVGAVELLDQAVKYLDVSGFRERDDFR